jgi:hypothetical protein
MGIRNVLVFLVGAITIASFIVGTCQTQTPLNADVKQGLQKTESKGFHGSVCDAAGKPIASARVRVNLHFKKTTGADGAFFVPNKELERSPGILLVLVEARVNEKELRCARFVDYATGKENATFRLSRSARINGKVLSSDGKPVKGAKLRALINVGDLTCHGTHPITGPIETNESGGFEIADLYPDTRYMLQVRAPGYERKTTDWIPVSIRPLCGRLEILLREAPGFIAGRVVDKKGKPMANTNVVLGHPCIPDDVCKTDSDGKFRLDNLVPGDEVSISVNWNFQKVKVGTEDVVIVFRPRE